MSEASIAAIELHHVALPDEPGDRRAWFNIAQPIEVHS